ncbi:hypothetical protein B4084_3643 [Bacillus cereus]|nr:hypothetical protein B4084_3643 [Bacillus cereus]
MQLLTNTSIAVNEVLPFFQLPNINTFISTFLSNWKKSKSSS